MKTQTKHRLSDREKIELVQEYFEARTSKVVFAEEHHIDRKALTRWIEKFGAIAQKEVVKQPLTETTAPETEKMVTIPYFEYLELLKIKHKYDVMHSVLEA